LLLAYENGGVAYARRSTDEGTTWSEATIVAARDGGACANAQPLVLADGRILYFYNFRPNRSGSTYRIELCTSRDGGVSWTHRPDAVYTAGEKFDDGCWEPAAIQLPSGQIQLFFANEGPYRTSDEQEITRMTSADGGGSWGRPESVSFRRGHRDGMPAPLVLSNGQGIVFGIEDNGLSGAAFKPVIIRSASEESQRSEPVGGESPKRWGALATPLAERVYAGAPFLCRIEDGRTLLSVQSDEDSESPLMTVYVGDANARRFDGKSHPFPPGLARRGMWNSLFVKGPRTVTAVSSTSIHGRQGVWLVDGTVE
jgi:hypothetical protein